jgi:hypothetical protein
MRPELRGYWSVPVSLGEGEHRCAYYCGDGRNVIYLGPAHAEKSTQSGMDALVTVHLSPENG